MTNHLLGINKDTTVAKHYTRLGEKYDDLLYYSPEFVRSLTSKMIEKLQLKPSDRFVDLGCGTGMYSVDILKQIKLDRSVIGVDPFREMLDQVPKNGSIETIQMDALAFSERPGNYDKILIKEAVHHIEDRGSLFTNLYQILRRGGRLLLVHVPPQLNYPIFEKALHRAEMWHADPDQLVRLLDGAGFRVERDALDYRHSLPREKYFQMVEHCYMSVLSSFSDEEIEEGLREIEQKYRDQAKLEFVDHFDYIVGIKQEA